MPRRPPSPCKHAGCGALVDSGYCPAHIQDATQYDRDRGTAAQRGYDSRWKKARIYHLACNPLCGMCKAQGLIKAATVVDHINPHRGDKALFWDTSNWQSLCAACHNSTKQRQEHRGA